MRLRKLACAASAFLRLASMALHAAVQSFRCARARNSATMVAVSSSICWRTLRMGWSI